MSILIYIGVGLAIVNLWAVVGIVATVTRNWHLSKKWSDALFAIMIITYFWGLFAEYGVHENWTIYVSIVCYIIAIISGTVQLLFPPKEISYENN